ncbi:MAG TPA: NusG domain II-containing protein [Spirochaetes bacterium]|nr:NusG domain II-containing protein [Spirochaetota bacterium]
MEKLRKKSFKIGDYVILLIVAGLIVFLFSRFFFIKSVESRVEVTGRAIQKYYDIHEDRVINVEGPLGTTRVIIEDGEVWVEDSPCREKICIKMGRKKRVGEQIVCVPNRVIVEITGENETVDAITR